jgi:putative glutamine amidotransferase
MKSAPLILLAPSTQRKGVEFSDASISLSNRYSQAILAAGGLPLILPCAPNSALTREYVRRADGVVLTGGDDVQTHLFAQDVPAKVAATVSEPEPERDVLELELVDEVFKQGKPLLGICRGHQLINIALGGDLVVDIPLQLPKAINHRRMDSKCDPVHDAAITPGSQLESVLGCSTIAVNSTHHQAVGKIAGPLKVSAASADGVVEALELKDPHQLPFLMSVQFHPERLYDRYPIYKKLFGAFIRACSPKAN